MILISSSNTHKISIKNVFKLSFRFYFCFLSIPAFIFEILKIIIFMFLVHNILTGSDCEELKWISIFFSTIYFFLLFKKEFFHVSSKHTQNDKQQSWLQYEEEAKMFYKKKKELTLIIFAWMTYKESLWFM